MGKENMTMGEKTRNATVKYGNLCIGIDDADAPVVTGGERAILESLAGWPVMGMAGVDGSDEPVVLDRPRTANRYHGWVVDADGNQPGLFVGPVVGISPMTGSRRTAVQQHQVFIAWDSDMKQVVFIRRASLQKLVKEPGKAVNIYRHGEEAYAPYTASVAYKEIRDAVRSVVPDVTGTPEDVLGPRVFPLKNRLINGDFGRALYAENAAVPIEPLGHPVLLTGISGTISGDDGKPVLLVGPIVARLACAANPRGNKPGNSKNLEMFRQVAMAWSYALNDIVFITRGNLYRKHNSPDSLAKVGTVKSSLIRRGEPMFDLLSYTDAYREAYSRLKGTIDRTVRARAVEERARAEAEHEDTYPTVIGDDPRAGMFAGWAYGAQSGASVVEQDGQVERYDAPFTSRSINGPIGTTSDGAAHYIAGPIVGRYSDGGNGRTKDRIAIAWDNTTGDLVFVGARALKRVKDGRGLARASVIRHGDLGYDVLANSPAYKEAYERYEDDIREARETKDAGVSGMYRVLPGAVRRDFLRKRQLRRSEEKVIQTALIGSFGASYAAESFSTWGTARVRSTSEAFDAGKGIRLLAEPVNTNSTGETGDMVIGPFVGWDGKERGGANNSNQYHRFVIAWDRKIGSIVFIRKSLIPSLANASGAPNGVIEPGDPLYGEFAQSPAYATVVAALAKGGVTPAYN